MTQLPHFSLSEMFLKNWKPLYLEACFFQHHFSIFTISLFKWGQEAFLKIYFVRNHRTLGTYVNRSSHLRCFMEIGFLKNFTKFTGKHVSWSLFFNKVGGLRPVTLLKMRLWHRCFAVNFAKFLRTPFLIEHLRWLLLNCCAS